MVYEGGEIMLNTNQTKAGIFGAVFTIFGILLRLFANDIAWPKEYGFSGPRENTIWAIREGAYQDIGLAFLIFGLVVIIIVIINWLWNPIHIQED